MANPELFNQALALQNEKKWDEALTAYQKILDESQSRAAKPEQNLTREQAATVSHNMSLIYLAKNELPLASVYSQKALHLNPNNSPAQELQKLIPALFQNKSIARDISFIENLNNMGLKYLPLEFIFILIALLVFFFLKKLFQFFLVKKESDIANVNPPRLSWGFYAIVVGLVVATTLFVLKWHDTSVVRVIVKVPETRVQTQLGENQAVITQAEVGTVLQVLRLSTDKDHAYVQVKYPGAYSGWVKKDHLELLNTTQWPTD